MHKDYLDKNLKSVMNINDFHIKPSKNIFEEAWRKKDNCETKKNHYRKPLKNIAAASICFVMLSTGTTLCVSENARALAKEAYKNLRNVFVLEKSGNDYKVVEKSENDVTFTSNFGGISIVDSNKKDCENKLGFSIYFPEKIGENFEIHTNSGNPDRSLMLHIYDIKLDDEETLANKFHEFIETGVEAKEIKKYKKKFSTHACYSALHGPTYMLSLDKIDDLTPKRDPKDMIKEFNIEDIKCQAFQYPIPYTDLDGYLYPSDCKAKPDKLIKHTYIFWDCNGIKFHLTKLNHDPMDLDNATEFIKEYMKSYKESIKANK